ncbi:putative BRCA2 domain-containing protein [Ordospora pajunii]|jgi:hypothetical protein|uniref:putative BRCA2 domain-containing protein n=1 Tax=Ordospora pajunii TaxID=3039483 RepID=UPI00295271BE|nr:putative BRCA2 domain-containing protein [Ordospora pajunii]KAH9411916.1 putative BRCA2 domain-containing protein [Ordospora pajunii]
MEKDSEVDFEDFFRSSMETNKEADEGWSCSNSEVLMPGSDGDDCERSGFIEDSENNETDCGLGSDFGDSADVSMMDGSESDVEDGFLEDDASQDENSSNVYDASERITKKESAACGDESLHFSRIDLDRKCDEMMFSGFTTGSMKRIDVRKESVDAVRMVFSQDCCNANEVAINKIDSDRHEQEKEGYDEGCKLTDVYEEIKARFSKEDENRVFVQFKWSWIYFFMQGKKTDFAALTDMVEDQMRIRLDNEYSILRRMVEGDEPSWRYMVVIVIGIDDYCIEIFDGTYSVHAMCDEALKQRILNGEIYAGSRLRVFGAELVREPGSIFEVSGASLMLHSNGVQAVFLKRKLGFKKKVCFRMRICDVDADGGTISCIQGRVTEVIETKYRVRVENYSGVTDDIEPELDKIQELARKAERVFCSTDLKINAYTKFVVKDESGECTVTWWNPKFGIEEGQTLRMVYLTPLMKGKAKKKCFTSTRRTYVQVVKNASGKKIKLES